MTLRLAAPEGRDELDALLAADPAPTLIAGGTDLLIAPARLPAAGTLVDLGRLAALRAIGRRDGALLLGAGVTVARLARDPLVARLAPVLALAAADFGSVQIRNRATIGGNIANAAPAADLAPALVAAAALALLWPPGAPGEVAVPVADLLARRPVLAPGEVIAAFLVPASGRTPRAAFAKLGRRQEPAIARLTLAASGPPGAMALVAGALGPGPRRLPAAERILNDGGPGLAEALAAEVLAAIPGRASAAYKARAVRGLGEDLASRLAAAGAPA
ncbi:MAG: FAD binding domain-containing protein [Rhodobacteraceae bacterium]|jgi:carbon-monoxide dehydrogenase medium subunit|nr:FAD binding domain-containing protein [Paracoccaceae bacterium]